LGAVWISGDATANDAGRSMGDGIIYEGTFGTGKVEGRGIMRVIFLDFDGPIIPIMSHKNPRVSGKGSQAWPSCVDAINRITDATGARIVVSSTWRADGFMKTKNRLKEWGVTGKMIGMTPDLANRGPVLWNSVPRGLEIAAWIKQYTEDREPVESFVILDDDKDMEHLMPHLIHTPFEVGLTESDAEEAIKRLNCA